MRAVLEEEGFRVAEKGVRLKADPIFRTGSVYEPVIKKQAKAKDLLETMLAVLTEAQAVQMAGMLEVSHPGILRKAMSASRDKQLA